MSAQTDAVNTALTAAASAPHSATVADRSATGQPIPDLIALDHHVAAKAIDPTNPFNCLKRAKIVPPGAG
jgi:hypothetical protein